MSGQSPYTPNATVPSFTLSSTQAPDGAEVPERQRSAAFGVPGGIDESPELTWEGFPSETEGFAVTMFDPDAPTASGFWHWAVLNVPTSTTSLPVNAGAKDAPQLPDGAVTLRNDAGYEGFVGAGPPPGHGPHRYVFAVHALDVDSVDVPPGAPPAFGMFNLFGHVIARAELTWTFEIE